MISETLLHLWLRLHATSTTNEITFLGLYSKRFKSFYRYQGSEV